MANTMVSHEKFLEAVKNAADEAEKQMREIYPVSDHATIAALKEAALARATNHKLGDMKACP